MPRNATVTPAEILATQPIAPKSVASQGTVIEQTRAIAEVQAMVLVAQSSPRKTATAVEQMRESCAQRALASRAFFRFPRAGGTVTGASVHLARELARCWGNITYGVTELKRDEHKGISEMQAFAWDVQTNTRNAVVFIVPHVRDTKQGLKDLTDMRDIYENNANNGARRLRECIFRVLPPYLKEVAKATCYQTLEKGKGDKPLEVRAAEAVEAFKGIGISRDRLEAKLGPVRNWTGADIANLEVSFMSIRRNEVIADDEFPRGGVDETVDTARAIANQAKAERQQGEGPDDSQMGEAHNDVTEADDGSPAALKARELTQRAEAITDPAALEALSAEAKPHLGFMPEELAARVTDALAAAETRIAKKGSK